MAVKVGRVHTAQQSRVFVTSDYTVQYSVPVLSRRLVFR